MSQGYASSAKDRQATLDELARQMSMDSPETLEKQLFFDYRDLQQLLQTEQPSFRAVIHEYNLLILSLLVQNADWVRFIVDPEANLEGSAFRRLAFLAKRHRVHLDIFLDDQRRVIEIMGPRRLVVRGTRYSHNLGRLLRAASSFALRGMQGSEPIVELGIPRGRRERVIRLPLESFVLFDEEKGESKVSFDSEVERKLFYQLCDGQWHIEREPFLHFAEESIIFLPDFRLRLRFGEATVYLEIIGFWTNDYLEKKAEKLNNLPTDFKDLILVIDSALTFPQTRFPTFYYSSLKDLPTGEIFRYLDKHYVQPHTQTALKSLLEKIDVLTERIENALEDTQFLDMSMIQEVLKCEDMKMASRIVEEIIAKEGLSDCKILPGFGLVRNQLIASVKETVSRLFSGTRQTRHWRDVEKVLKDLVPPKAMEPILKLAGFEVFWRSLTLRFVKPKK